MVEWQNPDPKEHPQRRARDGVKKELALDKTPESTPRLGQVLKFLTETFSRLPFQWTEPPTTRSPRRRIPPIWE